MRGPARQVDREETEMIEVLLNALVLALCVGVAGLMLGLATVRVDNLATIIRDGMLAMLLLFGAVLWEVRK